MADSGYYPRTLPRALNDVTLDPILRRYHNAADKADGLVKEIRRARRIANRRKIRQLTTVERILIKRINRLLTECQGYRELVLIHQEAPDEAFREFPLLCAELDDGV